MTALSLKVTAKDFRGPHAVIVIPLAGRDRGQNTQRADPAAVGVGSAAVDRLRQSGESVSFAQRRARPGGRRAYGTRRGPRKAGRAIPDGEPGDRRVRHACRTGVSPFPRCDFLERLVPEAMGAARLTLDWRVLGFSSAVAMIAALVFGLAPAVRGSRVAPQEGLRDGGRGTAGGRSHWFRHSLIVVETALAVLLLTCGGLLLQTFQHLRNTDLGMKTRKAPDLRDAPVPIQGLRPARGIRQRGGGESA